VRGRNLRAAADLAETVRRTYDRRAADRRHSALTRQPRATPGVAVVIADHEPPAFGQQAAEPVLPQTIEPPIPMISSSAPEYRHSRDWVRRPSTVAATPTPDLLSDQSRALTVRAPDCAYPGLARWASERRSSPMRDRARRPCSALPKSPTACNVAFGSRPTGPRSLAGIGQGGRHCPLHSRKRNPYYRDFSPSASADPTCPRTELPTTCYRWLPRTCRDFISEKSTGSTHPDAISIVHEGRRPPTPP
jgi:hypothetical protein